MIGFAFWTVSLEFPSSVFFCALIYFLPELNKNVMVHVHINSENRPWRIKYICNISEKANALVGVCCYSWVILWRHFGSVSDQLCSRLAATTRIFLVLGKEKKNSVSAFTLAAFVSDLSQAYKQSILFFFFFFLSSFQFWKSAVSYDICGSDQQSFSD